MVTVENNSDARIVLGVGVDFEFYMVSASPLYPETHSI
jgi:hypothetical protein